MFQTLNGSVTHLGFVFPYKNCNCLHRTDPFNLSLKSCIFPEISIKCLLRVDFCIQNISVQSIQT